MKLNDPKILLEILNIAIDAGKEILKIYNDDIIVKSKEDNSPLTKADINSNKIIINRLQNLEPNFPILSEESLIDWNERKEWQKYWLIDPLDGTKEFINKNGEYTVNISLIEKNYPIFGVIYAPAKSLLYYAIENRGAFKVITNSNIETVDEFKIIKTYKKSNDVVRVIGSRSHSNKEFEKWLSDNLNSYELVKIGSSLKFCLLAEGGADIYPRLGPTSEWDIAAGHIILEEAGGSINDIDNNKILYNTKENVINPFFIAKN